MVAKTMVETKMEESSVSGKNQASLPGRGSK